MVLVVLMLPAGVISATPDDHPTAKLRVITTVPDIASIVRSIGGNLVTVESIARGYQDPHYVEAKPSYVVKVSRADILFYIGMQLEIGWLPLLLQGSRNPDLVTVALENGIQVLQEPEGEVSRRFGDIHPDGNPHYWLDPNNGLVMARQVAATLSDHLAPGDRTTVAANLSAFEAELRDRISEWELKLTPWRGLRLVAYHQQFEYLAAWAGWETVNYIEEKPGVPPSPRHVAGLERMMKEEGITTLIASSFIDPRIPQRVAGRTGATLVVLPASVEGEETITDYFALFDHLLKVVQEQVPAPAGRVVQEQISAPFGKGG
jgi:ABC-type Zn uptake system ZnuABC Zn-binding protein ZnuA